MEAPGNRLLSFAKTKILKLFLVNRNSQKREISYAIQHINAWINYLLPPLPPATTGTSPLFQARGWGIAPTGLVPGGRGNGKSKISSR